MAGMFLQRWTTPAGANPSGETAQVWSQALAGITPAQMAEGMRTILARAEEWPPGAPAFRAACLGIPSLTKVRKAINGQAEPTAFSRAVWAEVDQFRYRQAPVEAADRMLREAYAEVVESVMRGQALPPDPVGAIEKPPEEPPPLDEATRERIKREMAERRRELGLGELEALQA